MQKFIGSVLTTSMIWIWCLNGWAAESESLWFLKQQGWREKIGAGFTYNIKLLSAVTVEAHASSSQNPDNDFMDRPTRSGAVEMRPDFGLMLDRMEFSIKPRGRVEWDKWEEGERSGQCESQQEWYINEWLARAKVSDTIFLSYGRENLQWGPSFLASPSNPFFSDNGKLKPKEEVKGIDMACMVWAPDDRWTVSLIANFGEGAQKEQNRDFHDKYAVKFDYIGAQYYGGCILSHETEDRNRMGGFVGWTISDALLLYSEGTIQKGSQVFYPVPCSNPFQACMAATEADDNCLEGRFLAGGSYTLETGPTLVLEYLYNSMGYDDNQARDYYALREKASAAYRTTGDLKRLATYILGQTMDPGFGFLRQQYLLFQYQKSEILNAMDLNLTYIHNLDDNSGRLIPNLDITIWDHAILFLNGVFNIGDPDTELGSILQYQVMAGVEYTF